MREMRTNNKYHEKILPAFVDSIKYRIIEIKSSLLLQNDKELVGICHKTQKYCTSYGFETLADNFKKMEKLALHKKHSEVKGSLEEVEEYINTIEPTPH